MKSKKNEIEELKESLRLKDAEIAFFRSELESLNSSVLSLIKKSEKQVTVLQRLFKSVVPTSLPTIKGFQFSFKYLATSGQGGDYFDVFSGGDKFKFAIFLTSTNGYMMSALMLSLALRFSTLGRDTSEKPSIIVNKMVKAILDEVEDGDKADIFYAVVDKKDYKLHYSLIGDIYFFHYINKTGKIKLIENNHKSIRKGFDSKIQQKFVSLNHNDKLIVCSPGIVNAKNNEGEIFGVDRVFKIISDRKLKKDDVHELRNEIFFELENFLQSKPKNDATVLVLEVDSTVIKLA